ncbi:MAG TPA: DAK2 domain-containing protein [Ruminiclostridium sp.]|nr:DAK2 domain-containing protein [Ruminiclostridium sp.]
MDNLYVSGQQLRDMLISAARALESHRQEINELNVFPVPDGDTGTNMSMTMNSVVRELSRLDACTVSEVSDIAASSLLRGARGNSGVILSLLFRGIARCFSGLENATGADFASALTCGVEAAYKAVMKPQEGTILTVAKMAAKAGTDASNVENIKDFASIMKLVDKTANETLKKTPEMLPVLKKAGVVDSGGKGLVVIFGAMLRSFEQGGVVSEPDTESKENTITVEAGETDEEINFTYCTEFIINKPSGTAKDPLALRAFLESIGDCVLVADDNSFIKVHFHTDNPGSAIQEALTYGYLSDIKIDNMRIQSENKKKAVPKRAEPEKPYGFIAVASGEGLSQVFEELGADRVVQGGQTMNPSTDDILSNIEATPAETVIVLPNNKNIILAAEQAASLADRTVYVLHTKTIPQGMTALVNFDPDADITTNMHNMEEAADKVKTGLVTFAARDSDFDGSKISKDQILAMSNGKILFTESDPIEAAAKLIIKLSDKNTAFVTIIYGGDIEDGQAESVRSIVQEKLGNQVEINIIDGGQPVYHFIISIE